MEKYVKICHLYSLPFIKGTFLILLLTNLQSVSYGQYFSMEECKYEG